MNFKPTIDQIETAVEYFLKQRNCSQAILMTFGPELGFPFELAPKIAAPFGAGIGRLGQTCGAVSGAVMVLGLLAGDNSLDPLQQKELSYALAREFVDRFIQQRSSTQCRELLGIDISTPEGLERVREEGLTETLCPELVRDAAKILLEMIRKQTTS
jgi:C_GCAxxG_C_C family probable redox protein